MHSQLRCGRNFKTKRIQSKMLQVEDIRPKGIRACTFAQRAFVLAHSPGGHSLLRNIRLRHSWLCHIRPSDIRCFATFASGIRSSAAFVLAHSWLCHIRPLGHSSLGHSWLRHILSLRPVFLKFPLHLIFQHPQSNEIREGHA